VRVLDYLLRRLLNVVVTVPWLSLGMIVGVVHKEAGVSILFSWVRFFFRLFDVEVTSEDENDPGQPLNGCIFTLLDQTSLLDGPIGVTAIPRPCRGIVNLEYALIPFFGWSQWVFQESTREGSSLSERRWKPVAFDRRKKVERWIDEPVQEGSCGPGDRSTGQDCAGGHRGCETTHRIR
jgi:1-acyl-sn-glycerol-3-phosphate acyltransferase